MAGRRREQRVLIAGHKRWSPQGGRRRSAPSDTGEPAPSRGHLPAPLGCCTQQFLKFLRGRLFPPFSTCPVMLRACLSCFRNTVAFEKERLLPEISPLMH